MANNNSSDPLYELLHEAEASASRNRYHDALSRYTRAIDINETMVKKKMNQILYKRAEAFLKVNLQDEALRDISKIVSEYTSQLTNPFPEDHKLDHEEVCNVLMSFALLYQIHEACGREQEMNAAMQVGSHLAEQWETDPQEFIAMCKSGSDTQKDHAHAENNNLKDEDASELECSLCMRVFYEPVTLPCGHTFDKSCLARVFDYTDKCPLCRQVSHILPVHLPVTVVVKQLAQRYLGADYEQRRLEEIEQKNTDLNAIPLFVLDYVLFPDTMLPLHIFEPRYRLMMRRCVAGSKCFGLVPAGRQRGEMAKYGTIAHITDIKLLPDGRSIIETVGRERFSIIDKWEQDGYACGKVKLITDERENIPQEETNTLNQLGERLYEFVSTMLANDQVKEQVEEKIGKIPPKGDYEKLSFWVAALLPLGTPMKLDLLIIPQTLQRLRVLVSLCLELARGSSSE
ncbi:hypothetical protein AKO1_015590 [Acrasis kona]|uniref:LON peptidase N-terminal domain and RING finger protein 1 n=1 Tax=Acrasis kona TaxID=1008807 RepID=A0AAW2ZHY7_9EUKA